MNSYTKQKLYLTKLQFVFVSMHETKVPDT